MRAQRSPQKEENPAPIPCAFIGQLLAQVENQDADTIPKPGSVRATQYDAGPANVPGKAEPLYEQATPSKTCA